MEDEIFISDVGLGEVVVTKFNCVREEKGFGGGVNDVEAVVLI